MIGWRTMHPALRALAVLLVLAAVLEAVNYTTDLVNVVGWPDDALNHLYALPAPALLCGGRAARVARASERTAWALIALGLLIYAGGNVYWSLALADLDEAPFPSPADGLWLGGYLFFYVGDRAARPRAAAAPRARLWLDGLIAALTVAAVSAAVVFKAVRDATGGDSAAS